MALHYIFSSGRYDSIGIWMPVSPMILLEYLCIGKMQIIDLNMLKINKHDIL